MIADDFHLEPASWAVDAAELMAVREQVFVLEQGVPVEDEHDALDAVSRHMLARDGSGVPIGTGRLTPDGHIGRMAVLTPWRGRGVGSALLRSLLELARERGLETVELHAQSHALGFYTRFGFVAEGAQFDECGIPHRRMRLTLAERPPREAPPLEARPERQVLRASDWGSALAATLAVLAGARRAAMLYTRDLDPMLYDTPEALAELKRIAMAGRGAQVRILLHDARAPLAAGHRLVALAQRLSSVIELRVPEDERDQQYPSAFVLNDRGGCFMRPLATRADGSGATFDRGRHTRLSDYFETVWERSLPADELRVLAF